MSNNLNMEVKERIKRLFSQGHRIRAISRMTGYHRKTIAKIVTELSKCTTEVFAGSEVTEITNISDNPAEENLILKPESQPRSQAKSKAYSYHAIIEECLTLGMNTQNIYNKLYFENAYTGSYESIKRYVRVLNKKTPKAVGHIETAPGEEAQVDWGVGAPVIDVETGKIRKTILFKMTLGFSRHSYEEVVFNADSATFLQCHINAFKALGGVTRRVLIDNLKTGIIKCSWYDAIENPLYESFSKHYGFIILAHRPGMPEHKGKTEAGIKYTQNALTGRKFKSLSEENEYLRNWNKTIAYQRIHGSVKRQVKALFEIERPMLQLLPAEEFELFTIGIRKVHFDCYIQIEKAYYSAPEKYIGSTVEVRWTMKLVKIYFKNELIRTHIKTTQQGAFVTVDSDLPDRLKFTQNSYEKYLETKMETIGANAAAWLYFMLAERGVRAFRVVQGVLSLRKTYSAEIVDNACRKGLEIKVYRYASMKMFCVNFKNETLPLFSENHEYIRSMQEYKSIIGGETTENES